MSLDSVFKIIESACERSGRKISEVQLLPVSKGQSVENILKKLSDPRFPRSLGENYFQELSTKKKLLLESCKIEWHYLGNLQSRKIVEIASAVHTIHSVSRVKELEMIAKLELINIPYIYLQFNVSKELTKSGFDLGEAERVKELSLSLGLEKNLVGLMTMASPLKNNNESQVRKEFASLRKIRDQFFPGLGLSMGMSADAHLAIEEGSSCVRIGTQLFGVR